MMYDVLSKNDAMRVLLSEIPDAFVIDLNSLPALSRQVGLFLRLQRTTPSVPLVFVGGFSWTPPTHPGRMSARSSLEP